MSRSGILLLIVLLVPSLAFGDVGFAKSSLWLSKTELTEGGSATLYASLSNASEEELKGSVRFSDDGDELGSVAIALVPGEGRIVSVSWTPRTPGTHSLAAALISSAGEKLDALTIATVVAAKSAPGEDANAAAAIESSAEIQQKIAELSPQVGKVVNPVFETVDVVRESGAAFLDEQITKAGESLASVKARRDELSKPEVLGAQMSDTAKSESRKLTVSFFFNTLLLYTLSAIRFVVGNAALFYPLFALLILGGLWKLFQRIRNPVRFASDI